MESWRDKVALVTGASAGIGRGIAERLATDGLRVIATHHKPSLKEPIPPALEGKISTFACDVTKEEDVKRLFEFIKENYGELHILVNNASLAVYTRVTECKSEDWRRMFDQNVLAVGMVTREALALMADDGFIINISSTSAHGLTEVVGKHVYCASKHALRLITEGIRAELDEVKPKIRVTMISPGAVAAEIGSVGGWMEAYPNKEYKDVPFLSADDIAETVVRVLTMPPNVLELAEEVKNEKGKIYPVKADVTKDEEVAAAFDWVHKNLNKPVHVLVNNAGVSILRDTVDGRVDEWKTMFETNVYAVGSCIREHLNSMKKHGVNDGHIVNICSIVGHRIVPDFPGFYVYTASKHAVKVITEGVRQELVRQKSQTKVTSISPGYVATGLFDTAADYSKESAAALQVFSHLQSHDVSNAVLYALSLPPNVRVHELTIQSTGEHF